MKFNLSKMVWFGVSFSCLINMFIILFKLSQGKVVQLVEDNIFIRSIEICLVMYSILASIYFLKELMLKFLTK